MRCGFGGNKRTQRERLKPAFYPQFVLLVSLCLLSIAQSIIRQEPKHHSKTLSIIFK